MSIELHGPGIDVRGVTAPGAPVIAIGHNAHIAFGLTSGLSQTNALYVEHLVPGHPDEYYYRGTGAADELPGRDVQLPPLADLAARRPAAFRPPRRRPGR